MQKNRGYTLIEIVITATLLGILTALAMNNINWATERGRSAEAKQILLSSYGGYQRTLLDEDWIYSGNPLTWAKLGMDDPNLDSRRFFNYAILPNSISPQEVRAVRRGDTSKWLTINLTSGEITKTLPY